MPLTSPSRRVSDAEAKLTLLYAVNALESATDGELWAFAAENELADYITLRLCLGELLAAGELQRGAQALRERLMLTDAGRQSLRLFQTRIPNSVREAIDAAAPAFLRRVQTRRQVEAVYELASRGDYRVRLSLREDELALLTVRLHTADRELAARVLRRFHTRAPSLIAALYAQTPRPVECAEPFSPAPDAALTRHSAHEYSALSTLQARQADLSLELLFPTRESAAAFLALTRTPGFGDMVVRLLT